MGCRRMHPGSGGCDALARDHGMVGQSGRRRCAVLASACGAPRVAGRQQLCGHERCRRGGQHQHWGRAGQGGWRAADQWAVQVPVAAVAAPLRSPGQHQRWGRAGQGGWRAADQWAVQVAAAAAAAAAPLRSPGQQQDWGRAGQGGRRAAGRWAVQQAATAAAPLRNPCRQHPQSQTCHNLVNG